MLHIPQHIRVLTSRPWLAGGQACRLLYAVGLIAMLSSCASDALDGNSTDSATPESVIFPKEELLLSINSLALTVTSGTRAVNYSSQDSLLDDDTSLGFYLVHGKRFLDPEGYKKLKDYNKYIYGDDGNGWYNYTNDGYDNLEIVPKKDSNDYEISLGKPIYYPWGKALSTDDNGDVAVITYAPYNGKMSLSTMEDGSGKYKFSVKEDQSVEKNVLASDLIIGIPECGNPFRLPAGQTVNIPLRHALSKVTLKARIAAKDSTICDSIKIYVKNISTSASVDFFHFTGMESILVRNKQTEAGFDADDILVADTLNDLLPCSSAKYSPRDKVLMCTLKDSNPSSQYIDAKDVAANDTIVVTASAIVIPGYVPDLQFSIRLYGAKRNEKGDKRNYDYDEYGHLYAEYSPKPVTESLFSTLQSGVQYKFLFSGSADAKDPDMDIDIDGDGTGTGDDTWIVGAKQE